MKEILYKWKLISAPGIPIVTFNSPEAKTYPENWHHRHLSLQDLQLIAWLVQETYENLTKSSIVAPAVVLDEMGAVAFHYGLITYEHWYND